MSSVFFTPSYLWVTVRRSTFLFSTPPAQAGDALQAVALLEAALAPPDTLGEARHLLANDSDVRYWLGCALHRAGQTVRAIHRSGAVWIMCGCC